VFLANCPWRKLFPKQLTKTLMSAYFTEMFLNQKGTPKSHHDMIKTHQTTQVIRLSAPFRLRGNGRTAAGTNAQARAGIQFTMRSSAGATGSCSQAKGML
jgi:hypothetical protein